MIRKVYVTTKATHFDINKFNEFKCFENERNIGFIRFASFVGRLMLSRRRESWQNVAEDERLRRDEILDNVSHV